MRITSILLITEISSHNRFTGHYFQNQKSFYAIFLHFWSLHKMSRLFKKISFVAQIFWNLLNPKNVITWMPESSCFRIPFANKGDHESLTTTYPGMQHFYPSFQLTDKLSQKTSLLVRLEILGPFFNTFTGNHMNSLHNRDKFWQEIQTPLSPKRKRFSPSFFFLAFLKST